RSSSVRHRRARCRSRRESGARKGVGGAPPHQAMTESEGTALRLADLAAAVGGTVSGDGDVRISGIAPLDRAGAGQLSFLASPKYAPLLLESDAAAVLVTPELKDAPGRCANRIVVAKPHEAILALLPRLYRQ